MPFLIQNMRQTYDRLKVLEERTKPPKEEDAQNEIAGTYGQLGGFNGMLMLENGVGMGGMMPEMIGCAGNMQNGMMPNGMGNPGYSM